MLANSNSKGGTIASSSSSSSSSSDPLVKLLSPTHLLPGQTTCDVYSLRHLILQRSGLPDVPSWIRPQAWSVLLHRINSEKRDWDRENSKGREEYYALLEDVLPDTGSIVGEPQSLYDPLLNQIQADLVRSRFNAFSFFQGEIPPSASCPISPLPHGWVEEGETSSGGRASAGHRKIARRRAKRRYALFERLDQRRAENPAWTEETPRQGSHPQFTSGANGSDPDQDDEARYEDAPEEREEKEEQRVPPLPVDPARDRRTNCILRILFLYSLLNPSVGYVQGMVEVASVVLWTIGSATGLPKSESVVDAEENTGPGETATFSGNAMAEPATNPHFEADSFWCFSRLLGELRELWDFEGIDHSQAGLTISNSRAAALSPAEGGQRRTSEIGGMARALRRFGGRLKWADEELWAVLSSHGLSPSMPYYSFRWMATLLSTSLPLPSLVRVWDALLCESDTSSAQNNGPSSPSIQEGEFAKGFTSLGSKVEFLIDILTALLMFHRRALLEILSRTAIPEDEQVDVFGFCLTYLQDMPDCDISPVLEMATVLKHRRVAASLYGEDEPPIDERDGIEAGNTVKDRAISALRGWTSANGSNSTPSRSVSASPWLRGVSTPDSMNSTPAKATANLTSPASISRASPGGLFSKYANAIQASDAAAELSKRGTNLTARAMERWNGGSNLSAGNTPSFLARRTVSESHNSPSTPSRRSSDQISSNTNNLPSTLSARFGSMGANFRRTISTTLANGQAAPTSASPVSPHPALQWNQDNMPHFPLPDVMNSPEGRTEYAYVRPGSIALSPRSAPAGRGVTLSPLVMNGMMPGTPSQSIRTSPLGNGKSREDLTLSPSAFLRDDRSQGSTLDSQNGQPRSAGPKPLLLAGSARAARENEDNQSNQQAVPASKVVRIGPLAGGSSSLGMGRQSTRGSTTSSASKAGSATSSQADDRSSQISGCSVGRSPEVTSVPSPTTSSSTSPAQEMSASVSLQEALQTAGALPPLPSLSNAMKQTSEIGKGGERSLQYGGGIGGLAGKVGQGTAPARAFGQSRPSPVGSENSIVSPTTPPPEPEKRLVPGSTTPRALVRNIASSSDIPLVPTEGRHIRRRGGPSAAHVRGKSSLNSIPTVGSGASSVTGSRRSNRQLSSNGSISDLVTRSGSYTSPILEKLDLAESGPWSHSPDDDRNGNEAQSADQRRPSLQASQDVLHVGEEEQGRVSSPMRYELTDEPVALPAFSKTSNVSDDSAISSPTRKEEKELPLPPPASPEVGLMKTVSEAAERDPHGTPNPSSRLSAPTRPASSSSSALSSTSRTTARSSKVRSKRSFKTGGGGASPIDLSGGGFSLPSRDSLARNGGNLSPVISGVDSHDQDYLTGNPSPLLSPANNLGFLRETERLSQQRGLSHDGYPEAPRSASSTKAPHSQWQGYGQEESPTTRRSRGMESEAGLDSMTSPVSPMGPRRYIHHQQHQHQHQQHQPSASRSHIRSDLPRDESDRESDRASASAFSTNEPPSEGTGSISRHRSYEENGIYGDGDGDDQSGYVAMPGSSRNGDHEEDFDFTTNGAGGGGGGGAGSGVDAIGHAFARFSTTNTSTTNAAVTRQGSGYTSGGYHHHHPHAHAHGYGYGHARPGQGQGQDSEAEELDPDQSIIIRDRAGGIKF